MPPDRFAIELVAPTRQFVYRPLAVGEPFWLGKAHHLDLARLVRYRGATHRHDALASVRPQHQQVASASDAVLDYEFLVIAIGAPAVPSIPGALTFDGGSGVEQFRAVIQDLAAGSARDVVFAVPPDGGWPLPLYELALLTASFLFERRIGGAKLTIVTPEPAPLALFGTRARQVVEQLLGDNGIAWRARTTAAWGAS